MYHINHMVDMKLTEESRGEIDPRDLSHHLHFIGIDNGMIRVGVETEEGVYYSRIFWDDFLNFFQDHLYEDCNRQIK